MSKLKHLLFILLIILPLSFFVFPSSICSVSHANFNFEDASRLVRDNVFSVAEPGSYIPRTESIWQERRLDRPVRVVLDVSSAGFGSSLKNEAIERAVRFIRLLDGSPDIGITGITGVDAETLANSLKYNQANGKWKNADISYDDSSITINGTRIPVYNRQMHDSEDFLSLYRSWDNVDNIVLMGFYRAVTAMQQKVAETLSDVSVIVANTGDTYPAEDSVVLGINDHQHLDSRTPIVTSGVGDSGRNAIAVGLKALLEVGISQVQGVRLDIPTGGVDTVGTEPVTSDVFHRLIPELKDSISNDSITVNFLETAVPRGGTHVNITVTLDEAMSEQEVNDILYRLSQESELAGILGVGGADDILTSGYFIETASGDLLIGPSFVVDTRKTQIVGDSLVIHGWVSEWASAQSLKEFILRKAENNPDIGSVTEAQAGQIPSNASLIVPSEAPIIEQVVPRPVKVGINAGAGRIGRGLIRFMVGNPNFDLVALNGVRDVRLLAWEIKVDTAHGKIDVDVDYGTDNYAQEGDGISWISINGKKIACYNFRDRSGVPSNIPWAEHGVEVAIDASGAFKTADELQGHLDSGAQAFILTVPPKKDIVQVVPGVNNQMMTPGLNQISAASCTTNNITPPLFAIVEEMKKTGIGISTVMMDTVHAVTQSQNLMDGTASAEDRYAAAQENALITTSGAAKAAGIIIPELKGKMGVQSVRVGNQDGSVSTLHIKLDKDSPYTAEEWNQIFRQWGEGPLKGILEVSDAGHVLSSGEILGKRATSIIDPKLTRVEGNILTIHTWYDNEMGYNQQVLNNVILWAQNNLFR